MLILTRKKDESIMVGSDIEITVIEVQGENVKLGISAPKKVPIHRKEVFTEIKEENMKASNISNDMFDKLNQSVKKK